MSLLFEFCYVLSFLELSAGSEFLTKLTHEIFSSCYPEDDSERRLTSEFFSTSKD